MAHGTGQGLTSWNGSDASNGETQVSSTKTKVISDIGKLNYKPDVKIEIDEENEIDYLAKNARRRRRRKTSFMPSKETFPDKIKTF